MASLTRVYGLWIINKAGGLIYQKKYDDGLASLNANDYLVLAGTFHGIHAIASKLSPVSGSSGLEVLEADNFKMTCLQALTGTKFVLFTSLNHPGADSLLRRIYESYSDNLKDPFYTSEMPIRSEAFDKRIEKIVKG